MSFAVKKIIFGMQWGRGVFGHKKAHHSEILITGEVSQLDVSSGGEKNIKTKSNRGNVKQKEKK